MGFGVFISLKFPHPGGESVPHSGFMQGKKKDFFNPAHVVL